MEFLRPISILKTTQIDRNLCMKDIRLSDAISAPNEGRRLRRRPSLYCALNIHFNKGQVLRRKLGTAAWPLLNRSAAMYVHICMHVPPACLCSDTRLARLASPRLLPSVSALRKTLCLYSRVGPHWCRCSCVLLGVPTLHSTTTAVTCSNNVP